MKKQLHPGARWLFRVQAFWAVIIISFFFFWGFMSRSIIKQNEALTLSKIFLYWFVIFLVIMIIAEIWVRMAYNRWFYEFTDSNLRQEHGVIWKNYSNVPYERVQNVDIRRGIIARMFGFSSVNIQTAGYSMPIRGYGQSSEGYIPAVEISEAERIRDFLMKKLSKKHQGL